MVEIRPPEVAAWMRARRKWVDFEITDLAAFATSWRAWWKASQPPERANSELSSMPVPRDTMDWECLQKAGANGLLLFVVALRWWGKASDADVEWRAAATDFQLALFSLTRKASPPNPSASFSGGDAGNAPASSKVVPGPEREGRGPNTRRSTLEASAKANTETVQPSKKRLAVAPTRGEPSAKKPRSNRRR